LAAVELPALPVRLTVSCQGPNLLRLEAQAAGCKLRHDYEVEMLPATHSPLNRETLQPTFAKTGQASLKLTKFIALELPPVVIKPSRLNEVRRDFYAALSQQVADAVTAQRAQRLEAVLATLLPLLSPTPVTTAALTVVARGSRDLAILEDATLDPRAMRVILPLTPDNVQAVTKAGGKLAHRERILWDIPAIIFADEWRTFQAVVNQLREQGFTGFRLNNLSHFALFASEAQISVLAGPWLYTLNSQAALALTELGASKFTLSIEDDRPNMAAILTRAVGAAATVVVYSPLALLTSRIPTRLPQGAVLTADSGESLRLDLASGLTVIGAGQDFALTGRLAALRALGCQEFIVDLSAAGVSSKRGQEVMAAVRTDQALPDTSVFNFERGLA
jgi:putative protease